MVKLIYKITDKSKKIIGYQKKNLKIITSKTANKRILVNFKVEFN